MFRILKTIYGERRVCGVDFTQGAVPRLVSASLINGRTVCRAEESCPRDADTVFALPPRSSLIRRLKSPFKSLRKTKSILPSLLDIHMPFSLEECSVAFTDLSREAGGPITAVASAVRRQDLRKFISDAKSLTGLDPMFVDVEGIALWDESIRQKPPVSAVSCLAVLKIEDTSASLVLGSGDKIISAHSLSSIDTNLVKRLLVSAFGSQSPLDWRVCGGGATKEIIARLIEELGVEWKGPFLMHEDPESFLARAVALRLLRGGADFINLREGEDSHERVVAAASSRTRALSVIMSVSGVLLIVLTVAASILMDLRIRRLEQEFTKRAVSLAGGSLGGAKGVDAVRRAEKAVDGSLMESRPFLAPFKASPAELLSGIASESASLKLLIESAEISDGSISITGTSENWSSAEPLRAFVLSKGYSTELERHESLVDESVRFKISSEDSGSK